MAVAGVSGLEESLEEVYDHIEDNNLELAQRCCDSLVVRYPNRNSVKIVSALVDLKLRRSVVEICTRDQSDAGGSIVETVVSSVPTDTLCLTALSAYFTAKRQPRRICEVYQAAVRKSSGDEQLMLHLFISHVRMRDFRKQEQTASKLYRLFHKDQYYLWAVMSLYLQSDVSRNVDTDTDADTDACCLALDVAERVIVKLFRGNKIAGSQEGLVYLMILEKKEKFNRCLEVLDWKCAKYSWPSQFRTEKKLFYMAQLKQWYPVLHLTKDLIRDNPSQWYLYEHHLAAVLEVVSSLLRHQSRDPTMEPTVQASLRFLRRMDGLMACSQRAPKLACIKLKHSIIARYDTYNKRLYEELSDHLIDFIARCGHLPCCFHDIMPFLDCLKNAKLRWNKNLVSKILHRSWEAIGTDPRELPNYTCLNRHLTWQKIHQCFTRYDDSETATRRVLELLKYHRHAVSLCQKRLPTDYRTQSWYLMMAIHSLYGLWMEKGDRNLLMYAMSLSEFGTVEHPSDAQLKLVSVHCYLLLGAADAAVTAFRSLKLHGLQLEYLGHLCYGHRVDLGHVEASRVLFDDISAFHTTADDDVAESLTEAFRASAFQQIPEFVRFRRRLHYSLYRNSVELAGVLDRIMSAADGDWHQCLHLLQHVASMAAVKRKDVWDNRDFKAMMAFSQSDIEAREISKRRSLQHDWCRFQTRLNLANFLRHLVTARSEDEIDEGSRLVDKFNLSCEELLDVLQEGDLIVQSGQALAGSDDVLHQRELTVTANARTYGEINYNTLPDTVYRCNDDGLSNGAINHNDKAPDSPNTAVAGASPSTPSARRSPLGCVDNSRVNLRTQQSCCRLLSAVMRTCDQVLSRPQSSQHLTDEVRRSCSSLADLERSNGLHSDPVETLQTLSLLVETLALASITCSAACHTFKSVSSESECVDHKRKHAAMDNTLKELISLHRVLSKSLRSARKSVTKASRSLDITEDFGDEIADVQVQVRNRLEASYNTSINQLNKHHDVILQRLGRCLSSNDR